MNTTIAPFDSGRRSSVNGLPPEEDIIHFLNHLFAQDPNKCFTRKDLMREVGNGFDIPADNQEVSGPHSDRARYYTFLSYLITDTIMGTGLTNGTIFAKRLSFGVYQHVTGNGVISPDLRKPKKVSQHKVGQARVSVKILRELKWEPEKIMLELGGQVWDDDTVEAAIKMEFSL